MRFIERMPLVTTKDREMCADLMLSAADRLSARIYICSAQEFVSKGEWAYIFL